MSHRWAHHPLVNGTNKRARLIGLFGRRESSHAGSTAASSPVTAPDTQHRVKLHVVDSGFGDDRTDSSGSGPYPPSSAPSGSSVPGGAGVDLGMSSDDLLLLEAARELRSAVNTILAVRGVLNEYDEEAIAHLYGDYGGVPHMTEHLKAIRQIVGY